jgi:hypothetical protein
MASKISLYIHKEYEQGSVQPVIDKQHEHIFDLHSQQRIMDYFFLNHRSLNSDVMFAPYGDLKLHTPFTKDIPFTLEPNEQIFAFSRLYDACYGVTFAAHLPSKFPGKLNIGKCKLVFCEDSNINIKEVELNVDSDHVSLLSSNNSFCLDIQTGGAAYNWLDIGIPTVILYHTKVFLVVECKTILQVIPDTVWFGTGLRRKLNVNAGKFLITFLGERVLIENGKLQRYPNNIDPLLEQLMIVEIPGLCTDTWRIIADFVY